MRKTKRSSRFSGEFLGGELSVNNVLVPVPFGSDLVLAVIIAVSAFQGMFCLFWGDSWIVGYKRLVRNVSLNSFDSNSDIASIRIFS